MMPTFHFHKLNGDIDGYFAIDVKTRKEPWRIIIQPLDENEEPYNPCNIDEIAHIINGDYGVTYEDEHNDHEDAADKYAEDKLIPPEEYKTFLELNQFNENSIRNFAKRIDRDPGIVLGRFFSVICKSLYLYALYHTVISI